MTWLREWLHHRAGKCNTVEDAIQDIGELRRRMRRKDVVDGSQDERIRMLEVENGELRLYLAALITLLLQNDTVNQTELLKIVEMVDRSDGCADGRYEGDIAAWGIGDGE